MMQKILILFCICVSLMNAMENNPNRETIESLVAKIAQERDEFNRYINPELPKSSSRNESSMPRKRSLELPDETGQYYTWDEFLNEFAPRTRLYNYEIKDGLYYCRHVEGCTKSVGSPQGIRKHIKRYHLGKL